MPYAVPTWVPALLFLLIFLGYRQSTARAVRPGTVVGIALAMLAFSFYGVGAAFGPSPLAYAAWATAYALAAVFGSRWFASRGMVRDGAAVRVPGSWVPMGLMLGIFAAKFVLGAVHGLGSPLEHQAGFVGVMSACLGLLSGGFGARAIAVHQAADAGIDGLRAGRA